jgi:hypothetical protein
MLAGKVKEQTKKTRGGGKQISMGRGEEEKKKKKAREGGGAGGEG